ncbi:MAG: 30S ribosomal protein S7, partial [Planctomycetes bacterium]|nr:30S ribosomal protein S7 [Planctomycetota bacterium]
MAKKFTASSSQLRPDAVFCSKLVGKFINCLMHDGKKSIANKVFYDAMDIIKGRIKDVEPLEVFETAINNVKPQLEVRSKRVGGASYQ